MNEAGYQAAVDAAFASAEETYWTAETAAENDERTAVATADVGYWFDEELTRATAAQEMDWDLNTPWSAFLVASATAHSDWWATVADDYLQWMEDKNAMDILYRTAVNAAHDLESDSLSAAKVGKATTSANLTLTRDNALASARYDYVSQLLVPGKVYVDAVSLAQKTYAIAVAVSGH